MTNENHNQGEIKSFLYGLENTKNANKPICNSKAVYLLSKANPIKTPAKIHCHFWLLKIALYKLINDKVQNNNNGTSGVELNDTIETNMVELIKTKARNALFFDKNNPANL